jgi:hypothetical protein
MEPRIKGPRRVPVIALGPICSSDVVRLAQYPSTPDTTATILAPCKSLIAEAGRRLTMAAPGAEVILFGSHAGGEAHLIAIPADVIVVSRHYAEEWRDVRGGLIHAALSEGRSLSRQGTHEAPPEICSRCTSLDRLPLLGGGRGRCPLTGRGGPKTAAPPLPTSSSGRSRLRAVPSRWLRRSRSRFHRVR